MSPVRANPARRQPTAFTLIELMVVIFIIGILIGIVITVIPKVKRAVYGAETQAQLSALTNAIEQYHNDFKAYPGPLSNNQLGTGTSGSGGAPLPAISTGTPISDIPTPTGFLSANYCPNNMVSYGYAHISGTQNLTLGLLGGLEVRYTNGAVSAFVYNPQNIFSDGVTPAPVGPKSLNPASPRRQNAYIQVKPGDLSTPNQTYGAHGASFADSGQRSPSDAMIPVFLDKYSEPLPILYMRTNVAAQAVVGVGSYNSSTDPNGPMFDDTTALTDTVVTPNVVVNAQWDLRQVFDYTHNPTQPPMGVGSTIGTAASSNKNGSPMDHHGLAGVGNILTDTIDTNGSGTTVNGWTPVALGGENGKNGAAYLRDPNFRIDTTVLNTNNYDVTASNTHNGVARQKDGYILISAGPDRLYGTSDDVVNPGPLLPNQ